jgi:acetyl-CoA C-acetyltransferase
MSNIKAAMIGWGHTKFGNHTETSLDNLISQVITEAVVHAGIDYHEIDEVFLGHFNAGFSEQDFTSSLVLQHKDMPRFLPITRVENACATGSAAMQAGAYAIEAKRAKTVLVVGVEKMTHLPNREVGRILGRASYVAQEEKFGSFVGVFGHITSQYVEKYGDITDSLASIAVKNHANGMKNPLAHLQKAVTFDYCVSESDINPMIASPLKRSDCSLVSDGAAAVVLRASDNLADAKRAVAMKSMAHVNDYLPMSRRNMTQLEGCQQAWQQALNKTKLSIWDLDLVETHDCFTIAELMQYEAMGLTEFGQGHKALEKGWVHANGKLPINVSGGLKSKGHPIGASGVSMHIMAAKQLCMEAGDMQLSNATQAGVFNMGGTGVANYVSILERTK